MSTNPAHGEMYSIQQFVSDFRQDIIEILLKVALNSIHLKPYFWWNGETGEYNEKQNIPHTVAKDTENIPHTVAKDTVKIRL